MFVKVWGDGCVGCVWACVCRVGVLTWGVCRCVGGVDGCMCAVHFFQGSVIIII